MQLSAVRTRSVIINSAATLAVAVALVATLAVSTQASDGQSVLLGA